MPKPEGVFVEIDLSEFTRKPPGTRCSIPRLLESMTPEHREKIEAAMVTKNIATSTIFEKINLWSAESIGRSTVERHRKGECLCGRS